ncbi:MAG: DMT family transporter [Bacillota bacterium]|nr:DMT family transporter [Bacillota bacterium]
MLQNKQRALAIITALISYGIFGFSFLFSKQALSVAPPFVLLAVRFIVAFALMNLLLLGSRFKLELRGKPIKWILLLGLFEPVLYFIFETYAVLYSPTSFVGIMIAMLPIVTMLLGVPLLKERLRPLQILCGAASVFGVTVTMFGQMELDFNWLGFLLLIGTVLTASLYIIVSRKIAAEVSSFERTYVMFAEGCLVFTILALLQMHGHMQELLLPFSSPVFWRAVIYLSAASSVVAYIALNYTLNYLTVAQSSIFANLTTVITILAGVLILDEPFGVKQIIGSAIIILAVYGVNMQPRQDAPPPDSADGAPPAAAIDTRS